MPRVYPVPVAKELTAFPAWLKDALAGRPNVYLVKNSGKKENGRPRIDDSRVSKWLAGEQTPSMELAALAARVLGQPESDALIAAGYIYGHHLKRIESSEAGGNDGGEVDTDLFWRQPEGMSDEVWERIKQESRAFVEWQIQRASQGGDS
jgi:hypothetical protein